MKQKSEYLRIKSKSKYFVFMALYFVLYPICKILYGRKRNWLVCERSDEAQDNGFILFKYLIENHPEIKPVYLIDKKSKEYKKVSKIGKTVQFGSFKHLLIVIGYPVKISTQLFGYAYWVQLKTYYRRNKTHGVHVFLQHGITKNDHEGLYSYTCKSLGLFVCGSKPEYESIYKDFHYSNNVPQYTGFARYDLLFDYKVKNQLLFMPTWRQDLSDCSDEEFLNTDFYLYWSKLINSEDLIEQCKKSDTIVKFYLHHSFKKFSHLFKGNEVVKIVGFSEESVQNLLKESRLLITDFSSVFFDFAYMKKPMVFYQFDEESFNSRHYQKGYFDYRRDGFGDVCLSLDEVLKSLSKIIDNSYEVEQKYIDRINATFVYHDQNNCDRIYEAITRAKK